MGAENDVKSLVSKTCGGFMMRTIRTVLGTAVLLAVGLGAFGTGRSVGQGEKANTRVYELRTYTTLPGRLSALNKRFADHTMKLFERHGMRNEMYWVPTDDARKDNTLIYLLSHESPEAAERSWNAFRADPEWIKVRDASEADGKILAKAPERVFMRLTEFSPGK
jgi:hypothetical protein